ncbi:Potassium voltage-gated channel sub H member 7 [Chytriomyces hyalinus]|nr:Potassium voltage-gated channel sub H member 7 [Chytriomyces hyalinus]
MFGEADTVASIRKLVKPHIVTCLKSSMDFIYCDVEPTRDGRKNTHADTAMWAFFSIQQLRWLSITRHSSIPSSYWLCVGQDAADKKVASDTECLLAIEEFVGNGKKSALNQMFNLTSAAGILVFYASNNAYDKLRILDWFTTQNHPQQLKWFNAGVDLLFPIFGFKGEPILSENKTLETMYSHFWKVDGRDAESGVVRYETNMVLKEAVSPNIRWASISCNGRKPWVDVLFLLDIVESRAAQFYFLLPAYDNKGQRIRLEHFDVADFDSISFMEYGLHSKSDFSTVWDLVMISAYFVVLWTTPFIVGFGMNHDVTHNIQIAVTIVYLLDSLVAMLTPQSEVTDSTSSFREYESARPSLSTWLRSWLKFQSFFDLISIIPFAVFMETEAEKVLSFIRLVRIVRIPGMMQRCAYFRRAKLWIDDTLGIGISKTFPVALTIFFFIHMNACTMYFVAKTNDFRGWDLVWPGFLGASEFEAYTWTFFLAVGNLFPMAFKPQTAIEQILAACQIFVGAVLYAAFVGLVSSAAISLNASGRLYNQKMEELIDYVKWKRLDTATRDKLVSYYETKYRGKYFEEDALLSDMNDSLREEIACHNTRGLMEKVPFLRREEMDGRDDTYFYKLATVLHARYFIPGDFMMKQGEPGSDMYFILSGKVNVFVDGNRVTSLYDSSYIGEMSLITKSRRTATVQVALPSVTYRLTRQDFLTVIGEFPDMRARINAMVEEGERIARSP